MKWNSLCTKLQLPPEPLTRGLPPPDPRSLCPLSSTEFVEPPPNKIPEYATVVRIRYNRLPAWWPRNRSSMSGRSGRLSRIQNVMTGSGAHPASCSRNRGVTDLSVEVKNEWSSTSAPPYAFMFCTGLPRSENPKYHIRTYAWCAWGWRRSCTVQSSVLNSGAEQQARWLCVRMGICGKKNVENKVMELGVP